MSNIIEIKARCSDPERIHHYLKAHKAVFKGLDHQIDTYFVVPNGRLKLRQGKVESALIHYQRANQAGPKLSEVSLYTSADYDALQKTLARALGVWVVVDKKRSIYFIENVKFHVDEVKGLGSFMEIEAIDESEERPLEQLRQQCDYYLAQLDIRTEDLVDGSYSDLLAAKIEG
ncbi:MAG: class IV adenylate cyclase [Bacteroidota bacterium]